MERKGYFEERGVRVEEVERKEVSCERLVEGDRELQKEDRWTEDKEI